MLRHPPAVLFAALLLAPPACAEEAPKFSPEQLRFFEQEVQPILKAHCLKCHGDDHPKIGFSLVSRTEALKGGELGPAFAPGKWSESLILKAVGYGESRLRMPPEGKLSAKDVATLTKWVNDGLPWTPGEVTVRREAAAKGGKVTAEARKYWAYQPVKRPPAPEVKNRAWVANPIDAFLLARLEAKGLTPAKPADPTVLIRRVTYDLTGLPPTPAEIDEFLKEYAAKPQAAYEKLIDRLLASPHYGEKWGRHWLDVVHYAETNGYERDGPKPFAWRYRDYVIRSFNADKPFDRFVKEQLAGDEIDREDTDCVIATGYYRLGLWDDEPADPKLARYDELDDWVATTAQGFLAMTMNCARCHEHKIDPIPHADYYRLLAFFQDVGRFSNDRNPSSSANMTDVTPREQRKVYEAEQKARLAEMERLGGLVRAIEDEAIRQMPAQDQRASEGPERSRIVRNVPQYLEGAKKAEYAELSAKLQKLRKVLAPLAQELALSINNCATRPPETHILLRGNPQAPGTKVEPGFPAVLNVPDPKIPPPKQGARSSGRRLALAEWIASRDNQLTARVFVNRVWQHHFGKGIVPTPNDFGKFGEKPTHPELLDWLAAEFMDGGWTVKRLHKLILLSNAYRMASAADPKGLAEDPANTLYWRFNMRRLTAEEVRDSMLAVSGKLNPKMFGPSIYPKIPKEVLAGQSVPGSGWGNSPPEEAARRSVYVHLKRSLLVPILVQHDQADTDSSCPVRYTTTVPTQALGVLNGEFSNGQAEALAERLKRVAPDLPAQVRLAVRLTTARPATAEEVAKDVAFIHAQRDKHKLSEPEALRRYCLLLLNANEFFYLD
jgi:hypothetical protein